MDAGGVFAIIFAILFLVVGALYAKTFAPKVTAPSVEIGAITGFLSYLVLCMPNVFFVYGFIADIAGNKYHYSVASLTALCGMIINRVLGGPVAAGVSFLKDRITKAPAAAAAIAAAIPAAAAVGGWAPAAAVGMLGGLNAAAAPFIPSAATAAAAEASAAAALATIPSAATAASVVPAAIPAAAAAAAAIPAAAAAIPGATAATAVNMCSLPGFEWLENKIAPQGIIMSMTVLWYLMIEMWDTGQGDNSVALGVTTAITFALQWFVLQTNGCLESYLFGPWSAITALVMAITFAGTSYGVQKTISVPTVPPTKDPAGNNTCPAGYEMIQGVCKKQLPILVGDSAKKTETCSPDVGDGDFELVGELFKDGELITSSIVD